LWAAFIRGLPVGARVLDLGTGAGAVPRFATGVRQDIQWVGVDYVEGVPSDLPNVEYRGGVAMEALPFSDDVFDAATSQFSIEYADDSALAELLRVLKPHAPLMVVAHHSASVILEQNRRRLSALHDLCAKGGLLDETGRLADVSGSSALSARQALVPLVSALRTRHPGQGIVQEAAAFALSVLGSSQAADDLARVRNEMGMEQQRLRALSRAALDAAAVQRLAKALSRPERPVAVEQVAAPGTSLPLAWHLQSR
jgi:SAM-dependent methyltransferase